MSSTPSSSDSSDDLDDGYDERGSAAAQLRLPGQTAAPEGPVRMWTMYVAHHAFRRDLAVFPVVVASTPSNDTAAWQALSRRWSLLVELLHRHHAGEDSGLWPLLRARVSAARNQQGLALLDDMAAEHTGLDPLLADAGAGLRALAQGVGDRADVTGRLQRAREALDQHLAHEEAAALGLVQAHLTDSEWREVERRHFVRPSSLAEVRFQVPWAVRGLPPALRARVFAAGGRAFQVTWALTRRRFERDEQRVFGTVGADSTALLA